MMITTSTKVETDMTDPWSLFDEARKEIGLLPLASADDGSSSSNSSKAALREKLYTQLRQRNGISCSTADTLQHTCTRVCLQDANGERDLKNGLFLCLTSGKVHDCTQSSRHPLTEVTS